MAEAALRLRGIRKRYGAIAAVDGADIDVFPGEIHALVGENGAGKSTLAAIAYGAVKPDAGTIEAHGTVGLVHQHFALIERLRVWENILLGREPRAGLRIDRDRARAIVSELSARHGLAVDPDAAVETLPIGIKQRVELLRELVREPAVLLLDEPTAALAPTEIDAFFVTVRALAERGTAILIVTHKLAEVMGYSGRVTVMRSGKIAADFRTAQTSAAEIARAMVGGEIPALAARAATPPARRLEIRALRAGAGAGAMANASLLVGAGEIVGIAGIEGNGQTQLADAIGGVVPYSGEIVLDGTLLPPGESPAQRIARGIRIIPQDRRHEALVLDWNVTDNVALGRQRDPPLRRGVAIDPVVAQRYAADVIERFDVRPPNPKAIVGALSGGNQQKIVVGRALAGSPSVVVAYQPTRGIDIGAATLVGSRLIEARNAGAAVLLISFELDEIFALADRVYVMFGGTFVGEFDRAAIDRGRIGALMAGG
ncbi:MAG: ABC transporter ATP-binding protein [Candidatus Velthaea sp.]